MNDVNCTELHLKRVSHDGDGRNRYELRWTRLGVQLPEEAWFWETNHNRMCRQFLPELLVSCFSFNPQWGWKCNTQKKTFRKVFDVFCHTACPLGVFSKQSCFKDQWSLPQISGVDFVFVIVYVYVYFGMSERPEDSEIALKMCIIKTCVHTCDG